MNIKKIIAILYNTLFFAVPLVLYPFTSELFEFNKMIVIYIFTIIILFFWLMGAIISGKFYFKKTILDIPILIFLGSQVISTMVSLDLRTSLLGYYSRFNGGLFSLICYSILYWGYVSNSDKKDAFESIKVIFISTLLSSLYGILEHFGIDKSLWIQDVQNRVFSTFGQPNWMAAWLVAVIPLTMAYTMHTKFDLKKAKSYLPYLLQIIFFITLLFTKSRSGIIGFAVADAVFWGIILIYTLKEKLSLKKSFNSFVINHLLFAVWLLLIGSPWTPKLTDLANRFKSETPVVTATPQTPVVIPALELGGSSSADIRKIVWKGALDVWKHYPLFGSGVETFAFSYYKFRPVAHNLVSEWDFLYNKAHNEYLNFMATTGTVGIVSYLTLIFFSSFLLVKFIFLKKESIDTLKNKEEERKNKHDDSLKFNRAEIRTFTIALLSGYASILVTNFFGFSVVPVNLLFYLFPAMAIAFTVEEKDNTKTSVHLDSGQKLGAGIISVIAAYILIATIRYWYSDILYNKADNLAKSGNIIEAVKAINSAIKLTPKEAVYHDELASDLADVALIYQSQNNPDAAKRFADNAMQVVNQAEAYSPNNLNIIRNKARIALKLSDVNPTYILDAKKILLKSVEMAPTEAKLFYNLSLTYYRIGDTENAFYTLKKTIDMKPNYKDARYAYAVLLLEKDNKEEAKKQFEYILTHIDPRDENSKKALSEISNPAK